MVMPPVLVFVGAGAGSQVMVGRLEILLQAVVNALAQGQVASTRSHRRRACRARRAGR
ncbi:hypothetical protein GCM10014713_62920 [Streptomyces purpureus]|uniref:Uncharacterized protein n=1 Tax=Streptomyces purpureus TaxID=1951 RepID=A0A918HFG7_9ACTN|nr:hypothetical protein GCM10014713_62920 [Streptomyces purpureus]